MIDPAALLARRPLETRQALTASDCILYALGVGADELDFVYEAQLQALPTMAVSCLPRLFLARARIWR